MTEEEFQALYIKIVESELLSPEIAERILQNILKILREEGAVRDDR